MHEIVGLFLLGVVYGATVCSLTCLPYLGPYLLSTGRGFMDGVRSSLLFLSGKLTCYMIIGGLSAYLGGVLTPEKSPQARWIMGIAVIAFGLSILIVNKGECPKRGEGIKKGIPLFLLGISTSLIPCPPLAAMFLLAAENGSLLSGTAYGLVYGLGLSLSPLIILGGGLSIISKVLRTEVKGLAPYLRGISVVMIVLMGARILI